MARYTQPLILDLTATILQLADRTGMQNYVPPSIYLQLFFTRNYIPSPQPHLWLAVVPVILYDRYDRPTPPPR